MSPPLLRELKVVWMLEEWKNLQIIQQEKNIFIYHHSRRSINMDTTANWHGRPSTLPTQQWQSLLMICFQVSKIDFGIERQLVSGETSQTLCFWPMTDWRTCASCGCLAPRIAISFLPSGPSWRECRQCDNNDQQTLDTPMRVSLQCYSWRSVGLKRTRRSRKPHNE